jgi:hypothetical protein
LTYRISVDLDEKELQPEDVRRVANYFGEALETMGYSYTLECSKDGIKIMKGLASSKVGI